MTYDGSAIRLYMNGVLDFENYVTDNFPNIIGDFHIAQRADGAERFDGQIDGINIWNIPLSVVEINQCLGYENIELTSFEITESNKHLFNVVEEQLDKSYLLGNVSSNQLNLLINSSESISLRRVR